MEIFLQPGFLAGLFVVGRPAQTLAVAVVDGRERPQRAVLTYKVRVAPIMDRTNNNRWKKQTYLNIKSCHK